MGQNQFSESVVEVMLSWMRWLTGWFWNIANSGETGGGFLRWFSDHWVGLAVFLIVAGVIVDWLIWMIRWRPYWLWLRKRQIIYEDVPVRRKPAHNPSKKGGKSARRSQGGFDDFEDPFAETDEDPYKPAKPASPADDIAEWDSTEDPYARPAGPVTKKVSKFGQQDLFESKGRTN